MTDLIEDFLSFQPLIFDQGSGTFKAGVGGDETPALVFSTSVGRPKYKKITKSGDAEYLINYQENLRGLLKIKYPIDGGIIKDMEDMKLIWNYIAKELKVNYKDRAVFFTQPVHMAVTEKIQITQYFFETLNTPAVFFGPQPLLSLYGQGKLTGLVLESGEGVTQCAPIYEGYYLANATTRINLGGRNVTEALKNKLRVQGYYFHTSAEFEIIKKIKEQCLFCELGEKAGKNEKEGKDYILPDGSTVKMNLDACTQPAEIMFHPEIIGLEYPGVHEIISNSLKKCEIDLRSDIMKNISLVGGNTLIPDFGRKIADQLQKLKFTKLKVNITAPTENRTKLSWFGGTLISQLDAFKSQWITKKDLEEHGERIFLQKTFQFQITIIDQICLALTQ